MSQRKKSVRLKYLKKFCYEQLWVFALFAPLVLIAILMIPNVEVSHQRKHKSSLSHSFTAKALEISSAELAAIIAKPLGELLLIEVYTSQRSVSAGTLETNAIATIGRSEVGTLARARARQKEEPTVIISKRPSDVEVKRIGEHS